MTGFEVDEVAAEVDHGQVVLEKLREIEGPSSLVALLIEIDCPHSVLVLLEVRGHLHDVVIGSHVSEQADEAAGREDAALLRHRHREDPAVPVAEPQLLACEALGIRDRAELDDLEHRPVAASDRHLLVDDIIDSAGTVCNAANALREAGATSVMAYVTHGVLSGGAVARVASSALEKLVITDSIQATQSVELAENIRVLPIANLIAEAMKRISEETSASSLFN